jgi:hypothetical protein
MKIPEAAGWLGLACATMVAAVAGPHDPLQLQDGMTASSVTRVPFWHTGGTAAARR